MTWPGARGVPPALPFLGSAEAASRMARVCALGLSFDELLPEALREAAALCGAEGALLAVLGGGGAAAAPEEILAWPPGDPASSLLARPPGRWEGVLPSLRRGEVLLLEDAARLPPDDPWRKLLAGTDGASALLHPLRTGSSLRGALLVRSSSPGRFGEEVLATLSMAASVLSAALDRRAMERRLAASEERYRFLAEHSLDFITLYEAGEGGRCLYASPVSERLLGVSADSYRRASRYAFVPEEDAARLREGEERVAAGEEGSVTVQHAVRRSDGSLVEVESILSLLPPGEGSVPRVLRVTRDITSRREMERSLFESRRLEAVGFLAGGVAHEFNNLLAGIQGSAEILSLLLRARGEGGGEESRHLGTIERLARRAAAITSQLLAYARRGAFAPTPVSLNRVVAETLPLLRGALPEVVHVRPELSPHLPAVQADPSLLRQVVTNLCVNAAEALPGGGPVAVRTRLVPAGFQREPLPDGWSSSRHGTVPPGDRVVLEVEDGGCGMDGETLRRIFDPFFSTKFVGRGLGLAAVLGIVESHGGSIEVASSPGAGTVVSISFATGASAPAAPPAPPAVPSTESPLPRRVLIADDEEDVRQVLTALIASLGYEAVEARDGLEALEIFSRRPDDFGVVLLDLMMPRLTGDRAFAAMRALRPAQKGILSSGYDEGGRTGRHVAEGFSDFLQKPFRRGDLKRRLEEILEPHGAGGAIPGRPGTDEGETR